MVVLILGYALLQTNKNVGLVLFENYTYIPSTHNSYFIIWQT